MYSYSVLSWLMLCTEVLAEFAAAAREVDDQRVRPGVLHGELASIMGHLLEIFGGEGHYAFAVFGSFPEFPESAFALGFFLGGQSHDCQESY